MRNLKKVLSLALAMVMLLGMMVVGASAKTSFKDDSDIPENRQVAAAVANQIEVLIGDDDKNFNPDDTLTRAEAAVILARLDLGADAAKALTATDAATFDDVAAGSGYGWAKPFIDYCAGNGYMVGVGNNRFAPAQTLTSVEFGLMISRVLGYRDANEGVTGAEWSIKAAALARKAGLGNDVTVDSNPMSRADMAQMVLNALTAPMVEYGDLNISIGDVSITSKATNRTHTSASIAGSPVYTYNNEVIQSNITPIRLCEEKFPDLKLTTTQDAFGRVQSVWTWKKVAIAGSNAFVAADYEYTKRETSVSLNGATGDSNTVLKIDGKTQTASDIKAIQKKLEATETGRVTAGVIAYLTGNGRQVLVYLNPSDHTDIDKVVVINTYVGKITAVKGGDTPTVTVTPANPTVTVEQTSSKLNKSYKSSDFENGDIVAYTAAYNTSTEKYDIKSLKELEVAQTGALTKWNGTNFDLVNETSSKGQSNFYLDDTKYVYSKNNVVESPDGNNAIYDLKIKQSLNVYVDDYGYALYIVPVTDELNYAAVIGVGSNNAYGSPSNGCTLLFPDGTIKAVTYKLSDTKTDKLSTNGKDAQTVEDRIGDVVTYTVDDDDVYTLTVENKTLAQYQGKASTTNGFDDPNTTFVNGKSAMKLDGKDYYTTSKTVFFVCNGTEAPYSYTAYTGYANMPSLDKEKGIKGYAVKFNSRYTTQIDAVYIVSDALLGSAGVDTYFVKPENAPTSTDTTGTYYILNAIVKGEETTVMVRKTAYTGFDKAIGVFAATNVIKDKNDIITSFTLANDSAFSASKNSKDAPATITTESTTIGTQRDPNNRAVLGINGNKDKATFWAYGADTKVYEVDEDYKTISISNMASVQDDANDLVFAAADDNTKVLTDVIIVEQDDDARPSKPSGNTETDTIALFGGKITMVTDTSAKVGSRYALVNANGTITFRFLPDIGAAAGANYTYKWTITDDETGEVLASNGTTDETVSASAITANTGNAIQKITATNIFSADGEYTITITDVKAKSSKLALGATFPAGVDKDKVAIGTSGGCSETTVADTNDLFLKFNPNTVNYNDKITVEFTVSNITGATLNATAVSAEKLTEITKATASNTTGKYSMEVALTDGGFSAVQVLDSITTTGTGSVVVTITSVTDTSATAKVKFELDSSIDWAELDATAGIEKTVSVGSGIGAVDVTTLGAPGSGLEFKLKSADNIISKLKAEYWYDGQKVGESTAATTNGATAVALDGTATIDYTPKAKDVVTVTVKLVADEYKLPSTRFNVTRDANSTNFAMASDVLFDKDGNMKNTSVDAGSATEDYLVKVGASAEYVGVSASSGTITLAGTEFNVPVETLKTASDINKIPVDVKRATAIDASSVFVANPTAAGNETVSKFTIVWKFSKDGGTTWTTMNTSSADFYVLYGANTTEMIKAEVTIASDYAVEGKDYDKLTAGTCGTVDLGGAGTAVPGGVKIEASGAAAAQGKTVTFTWSNGITAATNLVLTLTKAD